MTKEKELQWKVDYLKESLKQIKGTILAGKMGHLQKDWIEEKMLDSFCNLIDNSLYNAKQSLLVSPRNGGERRMDSGSRQGILNKRKRSL